MAGRRTGAAGAFAAAMAAAVALLSAPSIAPSPVLRLLRDRHVAQILTPAAQSSALHASWPRRASVPADPAVSSVVAVVFVLAPFGVAAPATWLPFAEQRRMQPVVRGPPPGTVSR